MLFLQAAEFLVTNSPATDSLSLLLFLYLHGHYNQIPGNLIPSVVVVRHRRCYLCCLASSLSSTIQYSSTSTMSCIGSLTHGDRWKDRLISEKGPQYQIYLEVRWQTQTKSWHSARPNSSATHRRHIMELFVHCHHRRRRRRLPIVHQ